MGLEQSQNQGRSSESRGSFSWFGLSIPWNQWFTAGGESEDFVGLAWAFQSAPWLPAYTLLFIRPLSPTHAPIQGITLKFDHLDCPGVLSSCSSKSEWTGSEVCLLCSLTLCFWRSLGKYRLWVFRLAVRSDTDNHDDEACCADESLNLLEPSTGSLAIHRSWLNKIRPLFCW